MLRFAANISTMFGEWPFLDRIQAAADVGFGAVECQWPYDYDADTVGRRLQGTNVQMVLINAPCGDASVGEVGLASLPGRQAEFHESIDLAAVYAQKTHCQQVHILAGVTSHTADHENCRAIYVDNMRWAADRLAEQNIRVMIEAINTIEKPDYHLHGTDDAVGVLRAIDRPNVELQFDMYHCYRMGEDIAEKMVENLDLITHMQVSGYPGRHEPYAGEIDYPGLFDKLSVCDYEGWIGCEYIPKTTTRDGLVWAAAYGIADTRE